jgi:tetratricopeptide (TPR) repeat protein
MIIDNADDAQLFFPTQQKSAESSSFTQKRYLAEYLPECAHISILVTTRNKQAGLKLAKGTSLIEIHRMNDEESKQLLRFHLGEHITIYNNLSALSSRLEHLPLALVQASAFIQENTITVDDYLNIFDQSDQDLIDLLSEDFETVGRDAGMSHAVAATWILSFEQIERQNALASELLSLMSLFDLQAIPMEFLSDFNKQRQGCLHQEHNQDTQLMKALGVLKAYSLVAEEKGHGLDMHRLVQVVTRKWLATKGTMRQFTETALLTVSHCYPFGSFEDREKCTAFLPHVQAVLKLDGSGSKDENIARASILHCAAAFFGFSGQWYIAVDFQKQAERLLNEVFGLDHPDTLTTMSNLATTYWDQGRLKEAELLEAQVLEKRKTMFGLDHPNTLTTMANLATTYWDQGRLKEAELLDTQVLEKQKTVLGLDHPNTLTTMANLAITYGNQGRLKEAELLEAQVLEKRKTMFGLDHPNTLTTMANLATTYWDQGRLKEAELLGAQVLEKRKIMLGLDHPDTLSTMANLAATYRNQGRLKEAELLDTQVLEKQKTVLGLDHPNTLNTMANLAITYRNQGRLKEAELLQVQVLEKRKIMLGLDHPDTLTTMANLAATYWNQGQWKEAESLEVQVLEKRKTMLGLDHPDTLTSMHNLAHTWNSQGKDQDALKLVEQCTEASIRVLGPEHPRTQSSLSTIEDWRLRESQPCEEG